MGTYVTAWVKRVRKRWIVVSSACLLFLLAFLVTVHTQYTPGHTIFAQVSSGFLTETEIWRRVFDSQNSRIMITPWAGAQNTQYSTTEILNRSFDGPNNRLRTSDSGGEGGGASTIADLGSGTAVGKTYILGAGSSMSTADGGSIAVTSAAEATNTLVGCVLGSYAHNYLDQDWSFNCKQVLFTELGGTATDGQIPHLNALSTGFTHGNRCVKTDNITKQLIEADADCGSTTGGGTSAWGSITGDIANQTDLQTALAAKQDTLGFTAVPDTRTVCGDALTSDVTCTKADVGLANVDNTSNAVERSAVRTLTNALIQPRTQVVPDTASITIDPFYTHIRIDELSQASVFEIPGPTVPYDGQVIEVDIYTTIARAITFDTDPTGFCPSYNTTLPTTTLADQRLLLVIKWNPNDNCWGYLPAGTTASGGGSSTWGSITGTLSAQTDLQTALNAKVDETITVCGDPLTANITCTASDVGLGSVTNDAQLKRSAGDVNTLPEKTTIVGGDIVLLEDSEATFAKKKATIANVVGDTLPNITTTESIYIPAGSLEPKGNCAFNLPAVLVTNGPKVTTISCTDNDTDGIDFDIKPYKWDGGTIILELIVFTVDNNNTEILDMNFSGQCVSSGDTVAAYTITSGATAESSTNTEAVITFGNSANRHQVASTAALTLSGSCANGDHVYAHGLIDASSTTVTPMSGIKIIGIRAIYNQTLGG